MLRMRRFLSTRAVRASLQSLTEAWEGERAEMKQLQEIKAEMDRVNLEIQNAEREYDLNRAAELKYGTLVGLQKQLQKMEDDLRKQVGARGGAGWGGA